MDAFVEATRAAVVALAEPAVAAGWEEPSLLEGMTVGAVAGHLVAGIERFESLLLGSEPDAGPDRGLLEFYGGNRLVGPPLSVSDPLHAFIRDDGAERATAGAAAVLAAFTACADRLVALLPSVPPDRWVPTARVPGRTPLSVYLPTRVVELAVHTDDLLASVGIDREPPPAVTDVVLAVALALARARGGDLAAIRAAYRGERGAPIFPVL